VSLINIRRPDLIGSKDVTQLATKVQDAFEDLITAIEGDRGGLDQEVRTMEWYEDGNTTSVLTRVQNPRVVAAVAKEKHNTSAVVVTGSVSFEMATGEGGDADEGWSMIISDISGLSNGNDYIVSLFIVGEV